MKHKLNRNIQTKADYHNKGETSHSYRNVKSSRNECVYSYRNSNLDNNIDRSPNIHSKFGRYNRKDRYLNHSDRNQQRLLSYQSKQSYPSRRTADYRENENLWQEFTNFQLDTSSTIQLAYKNSLKMNLVSLNEYLKMNLWHSSPYVEYERFQSVSNLRKYYKILLNDKLIGFKVPKESFNRWIFERSTHEEKKRGNDPLLTRKFEPYAPTIVSEIMEDVPIKVNSFPRNKEEAMEAIQIYSDACMKWLGQDNFGSELNEEKKQHIIDTLSQLEQNAKLEQDVFVLVYLLKNTKSVVQPIFYEKIYATLQEITCLLIEKSEQEATRIFSLQDRNDLEIEVFNHNDTKNIRLKGFNKDTLKISYSHYNRLRALYSGPLESFHKNLYCLLRRYETLFGNTRPFEGTGHQAAVPPMVFQLMHQEFQVEMECFASPLNCYFRNFASAFADTDSYFGSVGSFFDLDFIRGSFEANPPFENELMVKMVEKIESSIMIANKNKEPLSFIIVVPYWEDSNAIQNLINSTFCSRRVILEQGHQFVSGSQHLSKKLMYEVVHKTLVCWIQSIEGQIKWPCSNKNVNMVVEAWK